MSSRNNKKKRRHSSLGKHSSDDSSMEAGPSNNFNLKVHFPFIRTNETKLIPHYYRILNNNKLLEHDSEMTALQMDLEKLLTAVVIRNRIFNMEMKLLQKIISDGKAAQKGAKHKKINYDPLMNQRKMLQEKSQNLSNFEMNIPVATPVPESIISGITKLTLPKVSLPKNDIANRFWTTVNAYCRPVTNDDLNLLDKLIQERATPVDLEIPELGKHYSYHWSDSDLAMIDSSLTGLKPVDFKRLATPSKESLEIFKRCENDNENKTNDQPGPLTQRLVLAFMDRKNANSKFYSTPDVAANPLGNTVCLERRIRNSLLELGILREEDVQPLKSDSIVDEMKRVHRELMSVQNKNVDILKKLREDVTMALKRQELLQQLNVVDNEIIENCNEIISYKMNKKDTPEEVVEKTRQLLKRQIDLSSEVDAVTPYMMRYFPTE